MHGVEPLGLGPRETQRFDGDDGEAGAVNAGKNVTGEATAVASGLMIASVRSSLDSADKDLS